MHTQRIIFTRFAESDTNALLTLKSIMDDTSETLKSFKLVMNCWGYQTDEGQRLTDETDGDFNIGDFLLNDEAISEDTVFQQMMAAEGLEFVSLEKVDMREDYDTLLFS